MTWLRDLVAALAHLQVWRVAALLDLRVHRAVAPARRVVE